MDKRLEKIENYIRQYHMIEKGDRIVIGVSGGADSVCLLMALCSLQEKLGFQVLVCHVNHELRGEEAAQDEAYVEMLCHKMQVPFFAFHENVELIAKKRKESLEEAGRQAFEQLCKEQGGTKIAIAHHSNDNAETMLLNMARGTGLRGLCGIRPVYGKGLIVDESENEEDGIDICGRTLPETVWIITNERCASSGEAFVKNMSYSPKVWIVGRPTLGILDYSNCSVAVWDQFQMVYPTSRDGSIDSGEGMGHKGVPVDHYIPWTPVHLEKDVDMEYVLEQISTTRGN